MHHLGELSEKSYSTEEHIVWNLLEAHPNTILFIRELRQFKESHTNIKIWLEKDTSLQMEKLSLGGNKKGRKNLFGVETL